MSKIYLGSIALEKNRWSNGKVPTYKVSEYVKKAADDGFDGVELWENHFMLADNAEKKRLAFADCEYIFNSYLNLKNGVTDEMKSVAEAISLLNATAVKYNFSSTEDVKSTADIDFQTETLIRFSEMIPKETKLLCECHQWTIAENPLQAASLFCGLDSRFGAIIHLVTARDFAEECFNCYGNRICHIHSAYPVEKGCYNALAESGEMLGDNLKYFISRGFCGTITVEFTKDAATADEYYKNAVEDLKYLRKIYT